MTGSRASPIIAIRPEPGCSATLALGRTLGLAITGQPLFEVRASAWHGPDPASVDALLIGSANAIAHGGPELVRFADKPVHAVGEATARVARAARFAVAATGSGGLQQVIDAIEPPLRLLRLSGVEHVALTVPPGIAMHTAIAYETISRPLDPRPVNAGSPESGPLVLLHSGVAARHFAAECDRLGIAREHIAIVALAPRIAAAAGPGWREIHISPVPSDRHMLEMLRARCI